MRILFYSEVGAFGGHEVSMVDAVAGAASVSGVSVSVAYFEGNTKLTQRLVALQRECSTVQVRAHRFAHGKGDLLRAFVPSAKRRALAADMRADRPDWVVLCQGHIGVSICALAAARRSGARVASFVPMAHTLREMTGRGGGSAALVDVLLTRAYGWPERFLTISAGIAEQITQTHGVPATRIRVVHCGPDLSRLQRVPRANARRELGLDDAYWIGIVGRVEFAQKGHDLAFRAMAGHEAAWTGAKLAVVGNGPDLERAKAVVRELGLEARVRFLPWSDSPSTVYGALDLLLLPSRFEGVPIVMLEAMALELPVVGSDVDGMHELLPEAWRFPRGDTAAMVAAIRGVRQGVDPALLRQLSAYVRDEYHAGPFRSGVAEWVRDLQRTNQGRQP